MASKARALASEANLQQGGRRNLIVNGAMQVAQRGTSKTGANGSNYNTVDRFRVSLNGISPTYTDEQSTDAPEGFAYSKKISFSTAYGVSGADAFRALVHHIEGQDLQHLQWGTSSAKPLVLSFWVKSSVTGDYTVTLYMPDGTQVINCPYSITSAGTWEKKTLTVSANSSQSISNDNTSGLEFYFPIAGGPDESTIDSTSWQSYTSGNFHYGLSAQVKGVNDYWQITGVQLEVGDTATPFEHRSYGEELALCERYLQSFPVGGAAYECILSFDHSATIINFRQPMRSSPTFLPTGVTGYGGGSTQYRVYIMSNGGGGFAGAPSTANITLNTVNRYRAQLLAFHASGWYNSAFEHSGSYIDVGTSCKILFDAEL